MLSKQFKDRVIAFVGEENLEFLHHTRNYLSGSLIHSVLIAISAPILTHLLSLDGYGDWTVFATTVRLFGILFSLNISSGLVRYYLEKHADYGVALGTNLIFIFAFMPIPIFLVILFQEAILAYLLMESFVLVLAIALAVVQVSTEIYIAYLNASKQSSRYAVFTAVRTAFVLSISIGLMLYMKENRYLGRVYGELIVFTLFSAYSIGALIKLSNRPFKSKHIRYTLRFAVPLIPHIMSRYILNYIDRLIINQLTTTAATGLYGFASDAAMAMNLIVLSTVRAWRPIFFDEYREENFEKLKRMVKDYANNVYLLAAAIVLFCKEVIYILADKPFHGASHLVPVLVMGYVFVFLYTLYFQYAAYAKRTELISLNTFMAGFANIALNYYFIPIYGFEAAAYTTFASYGLLFFLHFCNAKFVLKATVIPLGRVIPNFLWLCGLAALAVYLETQIENYWLFLLVRVAMMAVAIAYYLRCKRPSQS